MQGHQYDQDEEKLRYKFDKSKGQKGDVNWNIRQKNESNDDVAKGVKKIHLRLYLNKNMITVLSSHLSVG